MVWQHYHRVYTPLVRYTLSGGRMKALQVYIIPPIETFLSLFCYENEMNLAE